MSRRVAIRPWPVQPGAHDPAGVIAADVPVVRQRPDDAESPAVLARTAVPRPPAALILDLHPHVVALADLGADGEPAARLERSAMQEFR